MFLILGIILGFIILVILINFLFKRGNHYLRRDGE